MFFGSSAVFIPKGISLDLNKVVFDSGYIHSAGRSIFIRNIKKAKKNEFFDSLDIHLSRNTVSGDEIPFIVYAHEDFSGHDKDSYELIDRGIEQCKIYVEKMSMGSHRLSSILNEMQTVKYKDKLLIPKAGSYLIHHNFRKGRTIWLISDRSLSGGQISNAGTIRYYICYEQLLKNDSPFFFFDENKPAWKSHTTLPHSLTAALINATRPIVSGGVICDPFAGTGTTWLEIKRLQLNNKIICSDLSPAASILHSDNICFFNMSSSELSSLVDQLKACCSSDVSAINMQHELFPEIKTSTPYFIALSLLDKLKEEQQDEDQEYFLSNTFVDQLTTTNFLTRIIFYIALRAELRFQGGFKRKSVDFASAFKKSLNKLVDQIDMLILLRNEIETSNIDVNTECSYLTITGTYSNKLIPVFLLDELSQLKKCIELEVKPSVDARQLEPNSIDLIICDPPYGFNTNEEDGGLAQLYSEFIAKAIAALRPNGQLILCLPAESYTGRDLPYCTRSDIISRQIQIKAHEQGRLVYQTSKSLPHSSLAPPYYWESERALRRTILHYRFQ
ncbi:MAG: hypothetical protein ED859_18620 [Desulfuromonadales bacterium]|nr:MAG: hypothetical protein ED859_18620 [Desulfuromonadales bacterium]